MTANGFIGDNRQSLKDDKAGYFNLDLHCVGYSAGSTDLGKCWKRLIWNGTDHMETIEQQAKLTEKHEMIIKQQTTPAKDLVES